MRIDPNQTYRDGSVTVINHGDKSIFVNGDGIGKTTAPPSDSFVPCLFGDDIKVVLASAQKILRDLGGHAVNGNLRRDIENECAAIITLCSNTRIGDVRADLDPSSPFNRLKRSEEILREQGFTAGDNDGEWIWQGWRADITNIPTVPNSLNEPPAYFIQYRRTL